MDSADDLEILGGIPLDWHILATLTRKIIQAFIEAWHIISMSQCKKDIHVAVTLSKYGTNCYSIKITNYGLFTKEISQFSNEVFGDLIVIGFFPTDTKVARLYRKRVHEDFETAHDLHITQQSIDLRKIHTEFKFISLPYWKEYLSFELRWKLTVEDVNKFKGRVVKEMISQQTVNEKLKFTFHENAKLIYYNHMNLDENYRASQMLSVSLTNIIKQTVNMDFRHKCFTKLKIENSHQAANNLMVKLLPMIHDNYVRDREVKVLPADQEILE